STERQSMESLLQLVISTMFVFVSSNIHPQPVDTVRNDSDSNFLYIILDIELKSIQFLVHSHFELTGKIEFLDDQTKNLIRKIGNGQHSHSFDDIVHWI
ncbi:hypothetical protein PENTCL1PPCAC_10735, partial [Pristionchus entomophagus]